jgi:hypothetical protein
MGGRRGAETHGLDPPCGVGYADAGRKGADAGFSDFLFEALQRFRRFTA